MKKLLTILGISSAAAAVMFSAVPGSAQTTRESTPSHVTIVGCVELEKDYRARMAAGRGGVLGTGLGVGDEYVLTNVALAPGEKKGSPMIPGDVSLTGKLEGDFVRQIGRRVEVLGTLKEIPASDVATDPKALPKLSVEVWHPSKDFCPAK